MRKLPHKDVAIIGLGWTGSIMAHGLAEAGLDVIAFERGPWRDTATDFPPTIAPDEYRYGIQHVLFLRPAQTTFTFRNTPRQTALPIREWGAFMLGNGVGGGGVHWNGEMWRFLPSDFVLKTHLTERYSAGVIPAGMTIQDWGVTYDELEPHYDTFEYLCGASGTAGNLKGTIQPSGNPFEGPRSRPYPTPASDARAEAALQRDAVRQGGRRTRAPGLSAAVRQHVASLYQPARGHPRALHLLRLLRMVRLRQLFQGGPADDPAARAGRQPNFVARDNCEVLRILLDNTEKRARGVVFVDTDGEEWEQPADLVLSCAFTPFNVQLLMLSGIGTIYDPMTRQGTIGRNFTHQTVSTAEAFFDPKSFRFNPFIASGSIGMCIDDFNGDNFDHGPLGFIGGGYMGVNRRGMLTPVWSGPLAPDRISVSQLTPVPVFRKKAHGEALNPQHRFQAAGRAGVSGRRDPSRAC